MMTFMKVTFFKSERLSQLHLQQVFYIDCSKVDNKLDNVTLIILLRPWRFSGILLFVFVKL